MTKGKQTRQRIVEAAAPIFNQRGYDGTSVSDLMEATGLQKGGIYRHFGGKEELAAAAFDYAWDEAMRARTIHVDEKAKAIDRLKQFIANFIDRRSSVGGGCPLFNAAVDADDGNLVLRKRVSRALKTWHALLESMVSDGIGNGEMRADVDPKDLSALIISALEGALVISRLESNQDALRRIQRHLNQALDLCAVPAK